MPSLSFFSGSVRISRDQITCGKASIVGAVFVVVLCLGAVVFLRHRTVVEMRAVREEAGQGPYSTNPFRRNNSELVRMCPDEKLVLSTPAGMAHSPTQSWWIIRFNVTQGSELIEEDAALVESMIDNLVNSSDDRHLYLYPDGGFGNQMNAFSFVLRLGLLTNRKVHLCHRFYDEIFSSFHAQQLLSSDCLSMNSLDSLTFESMGDPSPMIDLLEKSTDFLDWKEKNVFIHTYQPLDRHLIANPQLTEHELFKLGPTPFKWKRLFMGSLLSEVKGKVADLVQEATADFGEYSLKIAFQWRFCVDCSDNAGFADVSQRNMMRVTRNTILDLQEEFLIGPGSTLVFFTSDEPQLVPLVECYLSDIATVTNRAGDFHNSRDAGTVDFLCDPLTDLIVMSRCDYIICQRQSSFGKTAAAIGGSADEDLLAEFVKE